MSDALKLDPGDPNKGHESIPFHTIALDDLARIQMIAIYVAAYVNAHKPATAQPIDALMIAMDLASVHCTGRPQDFRAWLRADVVDAVDEYLLIAANINRACGKLPGYVRLRWQVRSS